MARTLRVVVVWDAGVSQPMPPVGDRGNLCCVSNPVLGSEWRNSLVPIKGFVHKVLRHSQTSGCIIQTALCYLEAKSQSSLHRKNQAFKWRNNQTELPSPPKLSFKLNLLGSDGMCLTFTLPLPSPLLCPRRAP